MDGAIDLRLIITLGGILFSVAGAAAVGKMQIKILQDTLHDLEQRLRKIDQRIDGLENGESVIKQRVDIMAKMNAPEVLEARHRETQKLLGDTANALERVKHLETMHNTVHPPVASERKAT
jgi:cell division septum initiation protein DivIVA